MADDRDESRGLLNKFATAKGKFGEFFAEVKENRRYYDQNFGDDVVPAAFQSRVPPVIPPTSRRAIDEPSDHILTFPHISVPVRPSESDESGEQLRAEVVRHACNAWWGHIARTQNLIGDARKPLLLEGKIAIRKLLRFDLIPDMPDRDDYTDGSAGSRKFNSAMRTYRADINRLGNNEFLWDVQLLDNLTVVEDPSNPRDPRWVYISYRIYVEEAVAKWPDLREHFTTEQDFDEVTYVELWTKPGPVQTDKTWEPGRFMQWVEDKCVHDSDSPYPYVPVSIDDAGYGLNHYLAKPHERYVGMTQHARDMFRTQAENQTSWGAVNRMAASPIGKGRNLPDEKEITVGPGDVINFEGDAGEPGAEDLEWMSHPGVPPGVVELYGTIDREANSTFKMDVLGGSPQRGVDTATEADLNVRNAVAKLSGPISALERVVARLTQQMLMDVELVLRAPVTLFGQRESSASPAEILLTPDDIGGFYTVSCQLTTSDQEVMQQSNARFWLEAARINPVLSFQTALERGEVVTDAMTEMIRRMSEDTILSPEFAQMRKMAAASDLGMTLQQLQADAQAQSQTAQPAGDESLFGPRAEAVLNPGLPGGGGQPVPPQAGNLLQSQLMA